MILSELYKIPKLNHGEKIATLFEHDVIPFIHKHCSDYMKTIKIITAPMLYHGAGSSDLCYFGKSFLRRMPSAYSASAQNLIDKYLKGIGCKAIRSNSIFCSGDYGIAENYGSSVYQIFPINNFKFTWSQNIPDLFEKLDASLVTKNPEKFRQVMDWGEFTTQNLDKAILSGNEILIHGRYLAIQSELITQEFADTLLMDK